MLKLLEGEGEQLVSGLQAHAGAAQLTARGRPAADQLALFTPATHPLLDQLASTDVNALTPIQALTLLAELSDAAKRAL
jgi:hypothetical protein